MRLKFIRVSLLLILALALCQCWTLEQLDQTTRQYEACRVNNPHEICEGYAAPLTRQEKLR